MLSNYFINFCHLIAFCFLAFSIFINDCEYKRLAFFCLCFLFIQYIFKYGKCGIINIEKYFLKDNFKSGFFYRLIKPIICYKINPMATTYLWVVFLYICVLYWQLKDMKCDLNVFNVYRDMFHQLKNNLSK